MMLNDRMFAFEVILEMYGAYLKLFVTVTPRSLTESEVGIVELFTRKFDVKVEFLEKVSDKCYEF